MFNTVKIAVHLESCSVSMISGKFNHNSKRSRTRFRFSSDGDSRVTYKCKLDDERFEDCKFKATYFCAISKLVQLANRVARILIEILIEVFIFRNFFKVSDF